MKIQQHNLVTYVFMDRYVFVEEQVKPWTFWLASLHAGVFSEVACGSWCLLFLYFLLNFF